MLDRLTATDFEPLVGAAFAGRTEHGDVTLNLLSVTRLREQPGAEVRAPFALLFRARAAGHLPQGIFSLAHERFGALDVFMVPVGRDADGLLLEAVFN